MNSNLRNSTTLENGIIVISEEAAFARRAAVGINVMAGGVHEPEEKAGLAHILEHMMFRGTQTQSSAVVNDLIEDLGGCVNAQTHLERTTYTATVIREDLGRTIGLLADMLINPLLDGEDLQLEKQIVEDENCRGCYSCSMNEALFDAAYPEQRLSQPVIGYEETVEAITRDDLVAFHKEHYVAQNLTVAVCADIPHSEVVALVEAAFCDMPVGQAGTIPQFTYTGGDAHFATRSEDSSVWIGFDITDLSEDEKRAICLYTDIIGGHAQSLLMQELREKRGLVYGASCSVETHARRDVVRLYLQGPSEKISEICDVTIATLHSAASHLDSSEMAKVKRRHHLNVTMNLDDLECRVTDMVTDISELGRASDTQQRYDRYQAIGSDAIVAAAQKMLSGEATLVMMAPVRHAPKMDALKQALKQSTVTPFRRAS